MECEISCKTTSITLFMRYSEQQPESQQPYPLSKYKTLPEARFEVLTVLMHIENTCQPLIQHYYENNAPRSLTFQKVFIHNYSDWPQTFSFVLRTEYWLRKLPCETSLSHLKEGERSLHINSLIWFSFISFFGIINRKFYFERNDITASAIKK